MTVLVIAVVTDLAAVRSSLQDSVHRAEACGRTGRRVLLVEVVNGEVEVQCPSGAAPVVVKPTAQRSLGVDERR